MKTPLPAIAALLVSLAAAPLAQAYEYSGVQKLGVARGDTPMQAWDNEGRLPAGDSRQAELAGIDAQISDRQARLEAAEFNIRMLERQQPDPRRLASLRRDYQWQVINYARWRESMERRRQAILGVHATPPADVPAPTAATDRTPGGSARDGAISTMAAQPPFGGTRRAN